MNPTTVLPLICSFENQNLENFNDLNIVKLPQSKEEQQNMEFIDMVLQNINTNFGGEFVLRHIFSELTYNIHEHAVLNHQNKCNAYIATKEYKHKMDISIIDDGLSIPGRFEVSNVNFQDDCQAIEKAVNNFSTVSDNPFERGNGLWTTIRIVIEGNCGDFLIVSRYGCLDIKSDDYIYHRLDDRNMFNGTLISIRLNKKEVQNIYDLIELHRHNFYKYGV